MPPGGPMVPGSVGEVNTTLPLVLGVASTLGCWGIGTLTGIAAVVLALLARRQQNIGDVDGARVRARSAIVVVIAGAAAGVVLDVLLLVTGVVAWPLGRHFGG